MVDVLYPGRYIEVFSSSMEEARRAQQQMSCMPMRGRPGPMRGGGGPMRPGPYDRNRMGFGGMGPPGRGRNFSDDFFGYGPPGGMGMRGGYGGGMMGGPGGRGGMFCLHMRGLPFRVTEQVTPVRLASPEFTCYRQEIAEWFSSVADPVDVFIHYNNDGRPSGEADVRFASDSEARRAMQKDKQNMQHRYIELFYSGQ